MKDPEGPVMFSVTERFFGEGIVVILLVCIVMAIPPAAQSQQSHQKTRHLVQMPLATVKLSDIGFPAWQTEKLTRSLNKAGVAPSSFNHILGSVPYFAGALQSFKAVSNYIALQHDRGLTGEELTGTVRDQVRGRDLPWPTMLPVSSNFLGERTRNIIQRVRRNIQERQGLEEGETEFGPASGPAPRRSPSPRPPGGPQGPRRQPF